MVVAIDGPAGAGKSTVAKLVAERTSLFYLNSGSFYRGLTVKAIRQGNIGRPRTIVSMLEDTSLELVEGSIVLDGKNVEGELRSDAVDREVAELSAIPEVRHYVNDRIKAVARHLDLVVEGRDMTTVVFPEAEVKLYLDASLETRARRRKSQGTSRQGLEAIEEQLRRRDEIDKSKEEGALRKAPDAIYLDTSGLTINEVCERVIGSIHDKIQSAGVSFRS
jgi:cytidylate kinase